jgi:hypothetical protein
MAPRILQETQESLQNFYFINQEKFAQWHQESCEKMGENERERWERFWHNRVAMRINVQMRREGFLLYERERRDPSWMSYKCHPSKRERTSQGRDTFRVLVVS